MTRFCRWGIIGFLVWLSVGCAPAELLEAPVQWPAEWRGRRLYHTPHAYIYAASDAAAGEADRLMISVAGDFKEASGRDTSKGLLIVTDVKDEPVISDFKDLLKFAKQNNSGNRDGKSLTKEQLEKAEKKLDKMQQDMDAKMKEKGLDFNLLLSMAPLKFDKSQLSSFLQFPECVAEAAGWAVVVPTRAAIRKSTKSMMGAMLKSKELGIIQKMAVLPMLAMMEPIMADMLALECNMVVFEQLALQQPDWDKQAADKITKAYKNGKIKQARKEIEAQAKKAVAQTKKKMLAPGQEKDASGNKDG
ncbi:MAG: hypothetical protein ACYTF1_10720 [Planctomycetota bacterium]|jgi:hypothetical protein